MQKPFVVFTGFGRPILCDRADLYMVALCGLLCREPGFAYGSVHGDMGPTMFRDRILAAGIAGLAVGLAVPTISGDTQESETAITCTNPVSGTSWQIMIDYRKATVDSHPAEIKQAEITWFDPKDGGNYTLDRKSGDLTASVASSTGGYFRHGRCSLEKSR
jgi:hypothetical protein